MPAGKADPGVLLRLSAMRRQSSLRATNMRGGGWREGGGSQGGGGGQDCMGQKLNLPGFVTKCKEGAAQKCNILHSV